MLPFLRPDLVNFAAYTPHPSGTEGSLDHPVQQLDRLDTNENPYDLPEALKQKLSWAYQQAIESNRYPDGSQAALKTAIAAYANESAAVDFVTPTYLSLGNGSDELIRSLLIATCVGGVGTVLVAQPTFSMYGILAETLGIPVVTVARLPNFEVDLAAAQVALAQPRAIPIRVVFMVHPNSPTGNALTAAEIDWLRSLPESILVAIDEAYFEFSQTTLLQELPQYPNWVILRTFSKAFRLAAHRVGYCIAHPEVITTLEKVRLPYNLPSTTQAAAQLVLSHRSELLSIVPMLLKEREQLFQALMALPLQIHPSTANFLFVQLQSTVATAWGLSPQLAHERLFEQLKATGTLVRHTGGGLRITVGSPEENQRTIHHLRRILLNETVETAETAETTH